MSLMPLLMTKSIGLHLKRKKAFIIDDAIVPYIIDQIFSGIGNDIYWLSIDERKDCMGNRKFFFTLVFHISSKALKIGYLSFKVRATGNGEAVTFERAVSRSVTNWPFSKRVSIRTDGATVMTGRCSEFHKRGIWHTIFSILIHTSFTMCPASAHEAYDSLFGGVKIDCFFLFSYFYFTNHWTHYQQVYKSFFWKVRIDFFDVSTRWLQIPPVVQRLPEHLPEL